MTKKERFRAIRVAAHQMAGEIEWAQFRSPPPLCGIARPIGVFFGSMVGSEDFREAVRIIVADAMNLLEPHADHLPMIQEVELEAAGLVQYAIKSALKMLFPHVGISALCLTPLTVKFRNIPEPLTQADPNMHVPSLASQRRGNQPWSDNEH